jgi:hypothetical protein
VWQALGTCCTAKDNVEGHQVVMWVNKSNGGGKKNQYFRHFTRKEMKKMEDNIQG